MIDFSLLFSSLCELSRFYLFNNWYLPSCYQFPPPQGPQIWPLPLHRLLKIELNYFTCQKVSPTPSPLSSQHRDSPTP